MTARRGTPRSESSARGALGVLALACGILLGACREPTEIVVVVDSDLQPGVDFDMIQFGFSASPLLSGDHDLWYKDAGNNFTHWSDPQSDALLDQMTQELDPAKQAALLNQQDAIMSKAFVDLTLYQKPNLQVATNQFINIRDNNAGSYFTYNTQQWGLNASAK